MQSIGQLKKSKSTSKSSMKQLKDPANPVQQPAKRKIEDVSESEPIPTTIPGGQDNGDSGRKAKRSRLSNGPKILGSLREGTQSLANMLSESPDKPSEKEAKKLKETRDKRRASLVRGKGESGYPFRTSS